MANLFIKLDVSTNNNYRIPFSKNILVIQYFQTALNCYKQSGGMVGRDSVVGAELPQAMHDDGSASLVMKTES